MDFEEQELSYRLSENSLITLSQWVVAAWDTGHFNWDLICGDDSDASIMERWSLINWLSEMKLLGDNSDNSVEDLEMKAAVVMTFFINAVHIGAAEASITPTEFIAGRFQSNVA